MEPLSKAKLKLFSSLRTRKFRERYGLFLVEGWKMVNEARSAGWAVEAVILRDDLRVENALNGGNVLSEQIFTLPSEDFFRLSQLDSPEGIMAVVHTPKEVSTPVSLPPGQGFLLEKIQDPGNLGTLLRIADWFGFAAVMCSTGTVNVFNPKTLRASMGAVFRVPVHYVSDWESLLRADAARIWLADTEGARLPEVPLGKEDWVLLSNEARGPEDSTLQLLQTRKITIPGRGGAESLNVAVAGGILAYAMQGA